MRLAPQGKEHIERLQRQPPASPYGWLHAITSTMRVLRQLINLAFNEAILLQYLFS